MDTMEIVAHLVDSCWPYTKAASAALYKQTFSGNFTYDSPAHPPAEYVTGPSTTPWLSLPIETWHPVHFVKAYVNGWIEGGSGIVVAESSSCATTWAADYQQP
jgi:hypothetical protein